MDMNNTTTAANIPAAEGRREFNTHPDTSTIDAEIALAAHVAQRILEIYPHAKGDLFIADHTHEELSEGSASVAWEGSGELAWTVNILDDDRFWELRKLLGIWFEPVNGCILAIHPDDA
jgi:hypothetical protein